MVAKIIRYWQVVDENNILIEDAHSEKEAKKIKDDYDRGIYPIDKTAKQR